MKYFKEKGLYHSAKDDYEPRKGDLIFFDVTGSHTANHMGIVVSVSEKEVKAIEGNHTNKVDTFAYSRSDKTILGYGELPENHPGLRRTAGEPGLCRPGCSR